MTHARLDMISFVHLDRVGSILQIEITDWHDQLVLKSYVSLQYLTISRNL